MAPSLGGTANEAVAIKSEKSLGFLNIPENNPEVISFECIDTRLLKAYRKISRTLERQKGMLFPMKSAGAVNDLLSDNEAISRNSLNIVDLLVGKGVKSIDLTAHTDCAADKAIFGQRPREDDLRYQKAKLYRAFVKMSEYCEAQNWDIEITCHLLDIKGDGKVEIVQIEFDMPSRGEKSLTAAG